MKLAFLVVGWLILSYAQKGEKNYSSRDYVTAEILRLRNYTFCLTKKKEKKEKKKKKKLHILKMWNLVTSVVQGPRGAL